ncbi:MAG: hypothetical protein Q8J62_02700, partial [Candidatus Cloacimonadaceae bacterium]|nr:hypothetical protein [Candidatus Cloacimonadaceae bacterium]
PLLLILIGLILLLVIIRFIRYFSKRSLNRPEKEPAGGSLLLDSDTRTRMVMKLIKDGWNAREISRELNIPLKDVERIIAKSRGRDIDEEL